MWFVFAMSYLPHTEMHLKVTRIKGLFNLCYLHSLPRNLGVVAYMILKYVRALFG
jgi:hypothetical protein